MAKDDARSAEILFCEGRVHHKGGAQQDAAECFEEVCGTSCVWLSSVVSYLAGSQLIAFYSFSHPGFNDSKKAPR